MRAQPPALLFLLAFGPLASACDDPPPEVELDTTVMVGPLELPISSRNDGRAPSDALHIDINADLVRMEGVHVLELTRGGRIPPAEVTPEGLTSLRERIRALPARGTLALTVHGIVPYGTTVRVVQAAIDAGYRNVSFAVRPPNAPSPTTTGWLELTGVRVVGSGDDVTFVPARPWEDFASHWQEVYEGCRAAAPNYVDCDPRPPAISAGGDLEMVLFTRGNGMVMRFTQEHAPDAGPSPSGGAALLEGLAAPANPEEVPPEPVNHAAFSFRFLEASLADNHISLAARSVCGAGSCPIVIEADEETETMRVLSLLGAVVPNGATGPNVVFRLPD